LFVQFVFTFEIEPVLGLEKNVARVGGDGNGTTRTDSSRFRDALNFEEVGLLFSVGLVKGVAKVATRPST
jgi:hypothetical protein